MFLIELTRYSCLFYYQNESYSFRLHIRRVRDSFYLEKRKEKKKEKYQKKKECILRCVDGRSLSGTFKKNNNFCDSSIKFNSADLS